MEFRFQGPPRFEDIPTFTRSAGYTVNIGLDYLMHHYLRYVDHYGLDVSPDFQRTYVWNPEQKVRFMEYMLRGGTSGLDIYVNGPTWQHGALDIDRQDTWLVLVDGKQRLDAALGFLNNEFQVFGAYYRDFTDKPRITQCNFRWHVNDLQTREEVLQWYLDLNTGGTVHTEDELSKVRALIQAGGAYVRPSPDEIRKNANLDREAIQVVMADEKRREEEDVRRRAEREAAEAAMPKKRGRKRT